MRSTPSAPEVSAQSTNRPLDPRIVGQSLRLDDCKAHGELVEVAEHGQQGAGVTIDR